MGGLGGDNRLDPDYYRIDYRCLGVYLIYLLRVIACLCRLTLLLDRPVADDIALIVLTPSFWRHLATFWHRSRKRKTHRSREEDLQGIRYQSL